MKKIYSLILAVVAAMPVLAQQATTTVATFDDLEGITLNVGDSVYIGTKANGDSIKAGLYGGNDVYSHIKQGPFSFIQIVNDQYGSWNGIAISACKDTTFKSYTNGLDMYHNVAGGAYEGNNYAIVYGSSDGSAQEYIKVDKGTTLNSVYVTNSAYSRHSFAFGDSFTKPFTNDSCYFKVSIIGVKEDGTEVKKDVTLASYHDGAVDYIGNWQEVDLTELGEVRAIKFAFDSSDKGQWGINTPTYVCLDNLTASVTAGISTVNGSSAKAYEVARYSLNGTLLSAPQKGINIIRMSDGTTRKVIVR